MVDFEITPLHIIAHFPMPCCNEIAEQLQDNGTFLNDFLLLLQLLSFFGCATSFLQILLQSDLEKTLRERIEALLVSVT